MQSVPLCLAFVQALRDAPAGADLTRYLSVCGGLILAIAAAGYGFRRLFAGTLRARARRRSLQVLDVLPLGGRQRLVVVRCYDRVFLLGQGDRELSPVAELDGAELDGAEFDGEEAADEATLDGGGEPARTTRPTASQAASAQGREGQRERHAGFAQVLADEGIELDTATLPPRPREALLRGGKGVLG